MNETREHENGYCVVCGCHSSFRFDSTIITPQLQKAWGISDNLSEAFNRKESMFCSSCGSSLRIRRLAAVLMQTFAETSGISEKSFVELLRNEEFRRLRIAEINACGALHIYLKEHPNLYYSEWVSNINPGGMHEGVRCEDLQCLSYSDEYFDIILTSETLEHIPDPDKAWREIYRTLKCGGYHIFTIPLIPWQRNTVQRARFESGLRKDLLEPAYHGTWAQETMFVYTDFGMDVVEKLNEMRLNTEVFYLRPEVDLDVAVVFRSQKNGGLLAVAAKEASPPLEWTGERYVPWLEEATIGYEHLHRYAYATQFVRNKRVLDLACGEGYGSYLLAKSAKSVVGIDIDEVTVRHASNKYIKDNLRFKMGSITDIPIEGERLFEVIVCFEAIEHIEDHDKLLKEVKRLLAPDGIFVVSSPNKWSYSDEPQYKNPFHLHELYFDEFKELFDKYFRQVRFFGQRIYCNSNIWPIAPGPTSDLVEYVIERNLREFVFVERDKRIPLYFIALASDAEEKIGETASFLVDTSNELLKQKDVVLSDLTTARDTLEGTVRSQQKALDDKDQHLTQLTADRDRAVQEVAELQGVLRAEREASAAKGEQLAQVTADRDRLNEETAQLKANLRSQKESIEAKDREIYELAHSESYRFGLFCTWPLRKIWQAIRYLTKFLSPNLVALTSGSTEGQLVKAVKRPMSRALPVGGLSNYLSLTTWKIARYCYRRLPFSSGLKVKLKAAFFEYFGAWVKPSPWIVTRRTWLDAEMGSREKSGFEVTVEWKLGVSSRDLETYFSSPAEQIAHTEFTTNRLMYHIWRTRLDLKRLFDFGTEEGRRNFAVWYLLDARQEYGLTLLAYPRDLLDFFMQSSNSTLAASAKSILAERSQPLSSADAHVLARPSTATAGEITPAARGSLPTRMRVVLRGIPGANLIGYARGEFGLGELVRKTARALATQQAPFAILNFQDRGIHGNQDGSVDHWITEDQKFATNIFHINADILPALYCWFGREFFEARLNIGYWAWELANCPKEYDLAFNMVDEVWAISEFVRASLAQRSPVPVVNMPPCVALPRLKRTYTKKDFNIPEDQFCFFYSFDSASYLERKNPLGVIQSFRRAFPKRTEKVVLVIKTMNLDSDSNTRWTAVKQEAADDSRIIFFTSRLPRDELLGMYSVSDCFVSLHRAEGFGQMPAEAMALGKPVIATNYGGTTEFAREGTACLVDYKLIPVGENEYPFWEGQVWADPDVDQASWYMKKLTEDAEYHRKISEAGREFIATNFNEHLVGARYMKRLRELGILGRDRSRASEAGMSWSGEPSDVGPGHVHKSEREEKTETERKAGGESIEIHVDLPEARSLHQAEIGGVIEFLGWCVASSGILRVELYCKDDFVGEAVYGLHRTDVGVAYPDFPASERGGFYMRFDTTRYESGSTTIRIVAVSTSGNRKAIELNTTIDQRYSSYNRWLERNAILPAICDQIAETQLRFRLRPLISFVAMVNAMGDVASLEHSTKSLVGQLYPHWELVVISPAELIDSIDDMVARLSVSDRVRIAAVQPPGSEALIDLCNGDWIGVIDPGDILDARACFAIANSINADPEIDLLYTDEDVLSGDVRFNPFFKPAWSPTLFFEAGYLGRVWVARSDRVKRAWKTMGYAQHREYDLLTEIVRGTSNIGHIPMVLCSRPVLPEANNRHVFKDGDRHKREGIPESDLLAAYDGLAEPREFLATEPKVSIIIPTCLKDLKVVEKCFHSLLHRTSYQHIEVLVVVNNVQWTDVRQQFVDKLPFNVISWDHGFNWSAINNIAAKQAQGEYLLFLNDDVEAVSPDWLQGVLRHARRPAVGAVGAKLLYPNGRIQHAGIFLVDYGGGVRHFFRFAKDDEVMRRSLVGADRESTAVTGACMMVRRELFERLGGFDEAYPLVCNDTDFCLRAALAGYSSVVVSGATLIHYETLSRAGIPEHADFKRFWDKWGYLLKQPDPYSNPNLSNTRDDWDVNPEARGLLIGRRNFFLDVGRTCGDTERNIVDY